MKTTKQVRCIKDTSRHTAGKIYTVVSESQTDYTPVANPSGKTYQFADDPYRGDWFADWFEIVGCPCPVKNCIAKHKS